jgi:putative NIF3 family GTP cyclohydrolase 1 type 2
MGDEGFSLYACLALMDCVEGGTTSAMTRAFGVRGERQWASYRHGYAGRYGCVNSVSLKGLVEKGMRIFGVERVRKGGACPDSIERIAIVAGGGDDVNFFMEAERIGVQAYITGE